MVLAGFPLFSQSLEEDIKRQNEAMEEAFEAGDMKKVASFYLDDAVLLSPGNEPVTGRKEIDAYWANTKDPVSWELEVIEVSADEKDIYQNQYYESLETKPPSWRNRGVKIEADDQAIVYQLGRSTLTSRWQGKENTSVVSFILVWKYTDEGYRIIVDTYSW